MTTQRQRETTFDKLMTGPLAESVVERVRGSRYLFATSVPSKRAKKPVARQGFFAVTDGDGFGTLDLKTYRAIRAEAVAHGLSEVLSVYVKISLVGVTGLHVCQMKMTETGAVAS